MISKIKLLFALSLIVIGLVSCSTTEEGTATYVIDLYVVSSSASYIEGSEVDDLNSQVETEIKAITAKYAKKWDYNFSGSSVSEALASQDNYAVQNFDAAIAEYQQLISSLNATQTGLTGGHFKHVYYFKISRMGETLRESDDLVFEYNGN